VTKPGPTPPMTEQGTRSLLESIAAGKGFVGVHAAADSFPNPGSGSADSLHPYLAMLGAEFARHGRIQPATLRLTDPGFPGLAGLPSALQLDDEWYIFKNYAPDLHVILLQETAGMKGAEYQCSPYPATWARLHQKGRVFFTSCGHHETALKNAAVQQILSAGIAWTLGKTSADVTPNLARVSGGPMAKPSADAPGVVSLFDGQTLTGWHINGTGRWTVENGAIVGRLAKGKDKFGHLISDAEYGNFNLCLKFKLQGDSGVYVRAQEVPPEGMVGIQANLVTPDIMGAIVEVLGHPTTVGRRIANPANRIKEYFRENDWNDLSLTVVGTQTRVFVNGMQTAELNSPAIRRKGNLALQLFGFLDTEVMFKDLRLTPAPSQ
jgi:type 1 glutamine amidotransferase